MRNFNDADAVEHPAQSAAGWSIRPDRVALRRPFRTMPRMAISSRAQHHYCHRDVIQRAEARAGDDDRIEIARLGQVERRCSPSASGTITPPAPSTTTV